MDSGAFEQAGNLANFPFLVRHVAVVPDAHQFYGMPIGEVIATQVVVIPNAVGWLSAAACAPCGLSLPLFPPNNSSGF